jgi:hypothetical protein
MLQMCEELGFQSREDPDDPTVRIVRIELGGEAGAAG